MVANRAQQAPAICRIQPCGLAHILQDELSPGRVLLTRGRAVEAIATEAIELWRRSLSGLANRSEGKLLIELHGIFRRTQNGLGVPGLNFSRDILGEAPDNRHAEGRVAVTPARRQQLAQTIRR